MQQGRGAHSRAAGESRKTSALALLCVLAIAMLPLNLTAPCSSGFSGLQSTGRILKCRTSRIRSSTEEQVSASGRLSCLTGVACITVACHELAHVAGDEERLLRDIERFKQREQLSSSQSRRAGSDDQASTTSLCVSLHLSFLPQVICSRFCPCRCPHSQAEAL